VRAGVPVLGANLPRAQMPSRMADRQLDLQLPGPALKAQQQLIRTGHCNLLPESQVTPMARIQIAKDISMANTLAQAALPGKTVVLLAGSGHADRQLGVPRHLPADVVAQRRTNRPRLSMRCGKRQRCPRKTIAKGWTGNCSSRPDPELRPAPERPQAYLRIASATTLTMRSMCSFSTM
jgi:hypothetical protein